MSEEYKKMEKNYLENTKKFYEILGYIGTIASEGQEAVKLAEVAGTKFIKTVESLEEAVQKILGK